MDGVIADFNGQANAKARYASEKGFFANLQPLSDNLQAIRELMQKGYNINILSTSPNTQADRDKFTWLMRHLPTLTLGQILFTRPNVEKADRIAPTHNSLLIDDYTHNLEKWQSKGGKALKLVNKYDSIKGKHEKLGIAYVQSLKELL